MPHSTVAETMTTRATSVAEPMIKAGRQRQGLTLGATSADTMVVAERTPTGRQSRPSHGPITRKSRLHQPVLQLLNEPRSGVGGRETASVSKGVKPDEVPAAAAITTTIVTDARQLTGVARDHGPIITAGAERRPTLSPVRTLIC